MKITRERLRQIIMEEAELGRYAFPKVAVSPDPEKAKEEDTPLEKELAIRINAHFRKNYPLRKQTADQIQGLMDDYPGVFRMYTDGDVYRGMHAPAELTKTILVDKWNVLTPLQREYPPEDGGASEGPVVGSSWSKKLETPNCFVNKMGKPENYGFILVASTSENKFIDEAPLTNYKFASYGKPSAVTIDPGEEQPQKPVAVGGNERWAPEGCGANQYEAVGIGPIKMTRAIITKIPNGATKQDVLAVLGGRVPDYIQFTNEVKQQLESAPQQEQPVTENRMRITPERLRQIISEEVMARLTEQDDDSGYEDYKTQSRRDLLKKFGQGVLAAAGGGAAFGPLGALVSQDRGARAARRRELYAANVEKSNTREAKIKELQDFLNNTHAWRWGKGEQTMMPLPGSEEKVNGLPSQIDVLPPTYAIAAMVLVDKLYGVPDREKWEGRFGVPDQQVYLGDSEASPQQIQFNMDTFFDHFQGDDFLDSSVLSNVEGIRRFPSSAFSKGTLVLNPELLFATEDYVLPENGMTVKDYYNWLYYNQFLSFDEIAAAPAESEDREKLIDLYAAAQPGQWAAMQRVAGEMRQDAIDNEQ